MTSRAAATLDQGQGEAWWWGTALAVIKATAADTNGELTVVDVTDTPGTPSIGTAVLTKYSVYIWTLEGEAVITAGDETKTHQTGDFLFLPRGTPLGFGVGEYGWRGLIMTTPGGIEEVIRGLSEPAKSLTLPPPPGIWPSFDPSELLAEHGMALAE